MEQRIFKLSAVYKGKPWGYEKWNLCCHNEGESLIQNGQLRNKSLWNYLGYKSFPMLIKIIKADKKLSIQVHPNDEYAKEIEHDKGKNECWYVLNAEPDAYIYYGLKNEIEKQSLEKILSDGHIEKYLNKVKVEKGNFIYIPSGVIHAIGEGVILLEVQQNSNITYRIYDYNRGRELQIEKANDVIDINKNLVVRKRERLDFFKNEDFIIKKSSIYNYAEFYNKHSFEVLYILEGKGTIVLDNSNESMETGDTIYIKEGTHYKVQGSIEYIRVHMNL